MERPILMLFAGPNGSGKSSLVHSVLSQYPDLCYICADDVAKSAFAHIEDDEARSRQALLLAEERILALIGQGAFCAYETVLSSDYRVRGDEPMRFSFALSALVRCSRVSPWRHHAFATAPSTSTNFTNENSPT